MAWLRIWWEEITLPLRRITSLGRPPSDFRHDPDLLLRGLGLASAALLFGLGLLLLPRLPHRAAPPPPPSPAAAKPVRPARPVRPLRPPLREVPARIPPDTFYPAIREGRAAGSIDLSTFDPDRDIIWVDDPRVWFSSDHRPTTPPPVDHHLMNRAVEGPFRNLVDLVEEAGGRLRVHAAYRPVGVHGRFSLHKEGRAIDLSADNLSLEQLSLLAVRAGFDWVFHEATARGGAHVHASVRRLDDEPE